MKKAIDIDSAVDTNGAAIFLGCSNGFLKARRMDGGGPDYYRLGAKCFYTLRALGAYREENMVRSAKQDKKMLKTAERSGSVRERKERIANEKTAYLSRRGQRHEKRHIGS